jgi:hypothetical protein
MRDLCRRNVPDGQTLAALILVRNPLQTKAIFSEAAKNEILLL